MPTGAHTDSRRVRSRERSGYLIRDRWPDLPFLEVVMIEREAPRSEWVPELAKRIIRRHWILGHCERCQGKAGTCGSLRWARDRITARRLADTPPDRH